MQRNPVFSQLLLYLICFGTITGRGNGVAFGFQDRHVWIPQLGFLLPSLSFPSGNPTQMGQDDFVFIHLGFKCNFTKQVLLQTWLIHRVLILPIRKPSFGPLRTQTDPFLSPENMVLICFIYVPHFTSLVPTLSLTCATEKELNFPSVPFPHPQQYELHQNQTPPQVL